jgi:hypothetical protein
MIFLSGKCRVAKSSGVPRRDIGVGRGWQRDSVGKLPGAARVGQGKGGPAQSSSEGRAGSEDAGGR